MAMRRFHFDIRQSGRRILAVLLVVLAVNILFAAFMVRPTAGKYRTLKEQSQTKLDRLHARQEQVEGRENFLAALDQAKEDLQTLRGEILSTKQRRLVVVQLELADLARQFRIDVTRVTMDNSVLENEGLERFVMVVPLTGAYANLRQFIRAVEDSDKFLVIERIALDQSKEGGTQLQLSINLATYFDAPELMKERKPRRRGRV